MEKVKYGKTTYTLVPGGFDTFTEDKLILRHLKEGKSLEEIQETAKAVNINDSIDLIGSEGQIMRSLKGYAYSGQICEIEDYLVEEKVIPAEAVNTPKAETDVEEIRTEVVTIIFSKPQNQ